MPLFRTFIVAVILLSTIFSISIMSSCRNPEIDEIQAAPENNCQIIIYGDGEDMDAIIEGAEAVFTIPSIDIYAPATVETATFALG